jgi:hypothetical protein
MKMSTVLLLVSLMLTIAAPFTLNISPSDNATVLLTLDVCNASQSAISVNADTLAVQESICTLAPASLSGYIQTVYCPSKPFVSVFKKDRPPEV